MRSGFSVAFHIGAHKTATSHLQRSLAAAAAQLAGCGVAYVGPDDLRGAKSSVPALFGLRPGRRTPSAVLAQARAAGLRLVVSEENYIGALNSPRRKRVTMRYPEAGPRMAAVAAAIGQPLDLFLGIRRPTGFLNAGYCQQLMSGQIMRMPRYREINPEASVDWADLVARLRAAPGIGRVTVWCFEDYATHFNAICAALLGEAAAGQVAPLAERVHASLSSAAVAEVLHRHDLGGTGRLGYDARRLLPVESGFAPFDGFDAAEHAAGNARYLAQIAAIAAMADVELLPPLWAATLTRA